MFCNICKAESKAFCAKCKQVYYCGRDHQMQDWSSHKKTCNKDNNTEKIQQVQLTQKDLDHIRKINSKQIDQDNLKANESVGTFRWNDSISLIDAPRFLPEFRQLILELNKGWQNLLLERFHETANEDSKKITVQPHQVDGLSYPMTIIYLIKEILKIHQSKNLNLVIMGAAQKTEERIFYKTNYFHELSNYFPNINFDITLVGPELSTNMHMKSQNITQTINGMSFRGTVSELLEKKKFDVNTIFIGFNPGFGSGYDLLLKSWSLDLVTLLDRNFKIIFTQANDYSDLRGETLVLEQIFENKIKYIVQPQKNPYRALTHYCQEGKQETSWCCSSSHFYAIQGWKNQDLKINQQQLKEKFNSIEFNKLIKDLIIFSNQS